EEEVFSRLEHEEPFKYKLGEIPAAFYDDPEVDDKICYCIVDGDENDRFSVSGNKDDDKFQLWQDKELDREEKASYELVVQATNCDKEPDYDESLINATAYLPVRVVVGDINDSPVAFMQTLYTAGITTDNQLGDVVLDTIKATTLDIYPNDVMTYAIVKDSWNYDELDHNYDEPSDPFKIDAATAVITLAHNPGDDSSGYIKFKVIVTDPPVDEGPHSSTADVTIQILSQNDQMEFVLAMSKSEFYDKRDEFVKTLEDITGLTAYVDEVATYYDESGAASESLISVFVHFVDEDGDIVGVGAVEDLFDRADTDDVVVLYEEFSVYSIQGRGRREAKPVAAVGRAYILALIIVSIILPIVIVVLVCVWCNEVKKYKRKLRAAKAVAFGEEAIITLSSRESEMNKITVPNTNQYAYEGSNPMWMQTVDANVFDNAAMKDDDEESDTTRQV
ncbi:PREDICTED: cadherin-23-like, partial [Priapulus caudatus]|uniref:Cadherin-23-like n=1 Tax=Priapulus caudatus TaxID=37621 RepID=A0ABM1F4D2_PRICU